MKRKVTKRRKAKTNKKETQGQHPFVVEKRENHRSKKTLKYDQFTEFYT